MKSFIPKDMLENNMGTMLGRLQLNTAWLFEPIGGCDMREECDAKLNS